MDTVFVRDLVVQGKHGVHEHERAAQQSFAVDIEAEYDARAGAASDRIDDTVNYSRFVETATRVVTEESFYLIERLAETIAREILADERVQRVRVTIRKPDVFVSGVPGITIERSRV